MRNLNERWDIANAFVPGCCCDGREVSITRVSLDWIKVVWDVEGRALLSFDVKVPFAYFVPLPCTVIFKKPRAMTSEYLS